jgi:hypothetical protein
MVAGPEAVDCSNSENIEAVAVELTPDDLRDIESAAAKITVHGARYPEKLEQMTGR